MSGFQRLVQRVAVRSVAAELDRRSARLEQALQDQRTFFVDRDTMTNARVDAFRADLDGVRSQLDALKTIRSSLQSSIDRLSARIDALSARMHSTDEAGRRYESEIADLRFELDAAQRSLAELTATLERLTLPG